MGAAPPGFRQKLRRKAGKPARPGNSCLVYADSKEHAEQDALSLYGEGYFDPEDNGYDGCDVDAAPATPEQEEEYKYDASDWEAICKERGCERVVAG